MVIQFVLHVQHAHSACHPHCIIYDFEVSIIDFFCFSIMKYLHIFCILLTSISILLYFGISHGPLTYMIFISLCHVIDVAPCLYFFISLIAIFLTRFNFFFVRFILALVSKINIVTHACFIFSIQS